MKTKPFLKSMALVICCLTSFVLVSCDKDDDKPNLKISPNKVEVAVGKTVTVSVSNGTAPYTTKSSDAKIAVAKSDKNAIVITGVKDGSAMITITDRKGVTGKVAVTVRTVKETPKTPKGLDFDKQSITVSVGKDGIVTVKGGAQPYSAVAKDVNIATVSVKENKVNIRGVKAGKTTITNLINRFYDIQDGKIRYDGININKIKKADLRRSLGIVLQETNLFSATVMENIRYGKLDATDEEVIAAAKLANADGFIRRLPDGYNTMLTGNGGNLSQGQRQLLSIARAAVANPPALILDEATSSIDTRTERLVQEGMDALMKGRTVFVIAHRLSTVQNSDVIMVLDHGHIIERGSHEDLIKQKGQYYQLYTGAFELE